MIEMYDSVDLGMLPRHAQAVAGYIDGHWQTFPSLQRRYPHAHHLSITVFGGVAQCLDVEPGDAHPEQAGAWVRSMLHRRMWRPCVYASLSNMPAVQRSLERAGLARSEYRLWVAHYDGDPHTLGAFDAKQYTPHALGRNLDASVCLDSFFPAPPPAPPKPKRLALPRPRLPTCKR